MHIQPYRGRLVQRIVLGLCIVDWRTRQGSDGSGRLECEARGDCFCVVEGRTVGQSSGRGRSKGRGGEGQQEVAHLLGESLGLLVRDSLLHDQSV